VSVLQAAALAAVAACGTLTVLVRDPLRQAMVSGVFGLSLALLFFVYQAPDVALSALVVSTVAVPLMVVLTLGRLREEQEEGDSGS
jgi:energy-converting hydrogenase B subunit D